MKSPASKYKKIMAWLRYQIENENYPKDVRLPSVRQLSRQFKVSLTTAQRALSELEGEGIIHSVSRSGYFANQRPPKDRNFWAEFSGLEVQVNKDIVQMLITMAEGDTSPISSAVLGKDLVPDSLLRRCLVSIAQKSTDISAEYLPPPGYLPLRQRIAVLMASRGITCAADDIIITSGDSVAMEVALWSTGEPGDLVIIEEPTYFGILMAIEQANFKAFPIATSPITGLNLDHVEAALKQHKVAAIVLNPTLQNPLGHTIPVTNRRKLVELAERHNVTIIEDDVFYDLHPEENRPPAIKHFETSHSVIYCSSFSKTVSPGYRVGWCVPGKHRSKVMARMMERTISASSLPQQILSDFLRRGYYQPHVARLRDKLANNARAIQKIIQDHFPAGTVASDPDGGFIIWIDLPRKINCLQFIELARQQSIFLPKSTVFYADGREVPSLRICFSTGDIRNTLSDLISLGKIATVLASNND
ncbi:PLP-dependent aminotransferase family protein [Thalassospira marina]|uniref:aminotransferase-like domain-containing protein n=1 Tax=Thalassospira marina TaxID=2048283 RepID=UPI0013FD5BBF|nr:PLP-dependent aminotransferase family protein [Thalassospira marina]